MDYQGARRTRPIPVTADARPPAWPAPDDPGHAPSSGGATGSFQATGTPGGTQQALDPARTPAQGFPAVPPAATPEGEDGTPALAAPAGPGPRGRRGSRRSGRLSRSRLAWLAAAAAVILAAAGFGVYKLLYVPRVNAPVPASLRLPTNVAASPGFDAALGKWQHIGTRALDPKALTLDELYPAQFELNGSSYVRTAASVSKDCTLAVYGSDLQQALEAGHCTQLLRASYVSGDGKMMGTVGVANLNSSTDTQKAGQVTGQSEIIAPLAAQKGPTKKLGTGTGVVQAEIKGHYLILMWAQFTNLKSPSGTSQRDQLEQFAANLVTGSANIDLSGRMLTTKPAG